MWRIGSQPSNSTSCSDDVRRLLVLVTSKLYRGLQVTSSFSIWGCFEGLYWERYILKGQIAFEGHWRLQSWTLINMFLKSWTPTDYFSNSTDSLVTSCRLSPFIGPGEISERDRSKSKCFQVQPGTCGDLSVSLYYFEVYSIDSYKMIGNLPEVFNFNQLFLKLNWVICN